MEYHGNRATGWAKYLLAPWARPTIDTCGQTTTQTIQNLTCAGKQLERDWPLPLLDKWPPLFLNMMFARRSDTKGAFKPLLEFGPQNKRLRTIVMSQREGLQKDAHTPSAIYLHSWIRFIQFLRQCQTCGFQNWLVWEAMDPALGCAGISYGLYPPGVTSDKVGRGNMQNRCSTSDLQLCMTNCAVTLVITLF